MHGNFLPCAPRANGPCLSSTIRIRIPGFLDLPSHLGRHFIPFIDDAVRFCEETNNWTEESQFKWNMKWDI